ncbi:MAG TPA: M61 family peptidase [Gammaproteobacteria bacterium]|jgi:predicted metalloprotease with PDZ domain|nr:M61 family peptidase [Gammaproteobacteria bacterium]
MMKSRLAPLSLLVLALSAGPVRAADLITLDVDLRESVRQLFHGHEVIPVKPGPLTLYYPKWIPGEHSPSGPLENLAGLKLTAGGKPLAWRRDLKEMYAIHLEVPQGVSSLDVTFDFLSPSNGGNFGQSVSATPDIADLEWNQVLLYPAGAAAKDIQFQPSVKLPAGWQYATALDTASKDAGGARFKPVSLENLVDSPLIAGLHFKRVDIAPGDKVPVHLNLVADTDEDLAITPKQTEAMVNLVKQANILFGSHHYDHYDFLFTLSENTGHFGLEHHQSSDDRSWSDLYTTPETTLVGAHLLPHEYVHSWNGKFRRPAGLATPDFTSQPMQDDLLWVYEGLTEYFGNVLSARSGSITPTQYRETLAFDAATMDKRPGRSWRPLQDTNDEAQILYYAPREWQNWRRVQDFYVEGELIWLDVDTKLRELSAGRKSMDDFAHAFYGMDDGSYVVHPYTFDDVVNTLKGVQEYDWAAFLRERLDTTQPAAPLDGIARGGYALAYTDTPSEYFKAYEKVRKVQNLMFSIGLQLDASEHDKGMVQDVLWDGPAFKAGIGPGMKLVAVNGRAFDADKDVLKDAITAAKSSKTPLRLLLRQQDTYLSFDVDYHGGLKYPVLTPVAGKAPLLDAIIAAH